MRARHAWAALVLAACAPPARGESLDQACTRLCKAAAGVRDLYQYLTASEHASQGQQPMVMTIRSSAELHVLRDGEQRLARCFSEMSVGWQRAEADFAAPQPGMSFSRLTVFDGTFLWVEGRNPGTRGALFVVKTRPAAGKAEALPRPGSSAQMRGDAAGVLVARTPREAFKRLELGWTLKLKGRGAYKRRPTTIVEAVAKPGRRARVHFGGWQKPIARRLLHFDDATGTLLAVKSYDKGGAAVRTTDTTNLKLNAGEIDKDLFRYAPPQEANLDDRTKKEKPALR